MEIRCRYLEKGHKRISVEKRPNTGHNEKLIGLWDSWRKEVRIRLQR